MNNGTQKPSFFQIKSQEGNPARDRRQAPHLISGHTSLTSLGGVENVISDEALFKLLDDRQFSLENIPSKPDPVFELVGKPICTAGNLTTISAQAKSGKTAFLGAMIGALIAPGFQGGSGPDTLGVTAHNLGNKAVIHFDTEQCPYDHYLVIKTALERGKAPAAPGWLRSYSLADVSFSERLSALDAELKRASAACGGICCVLLDGVADFCLDPNNSEAAFTLVAHLHARAINYNCPIVCVLHENPGPNDYGKTRGHLGSQLERKSETNLRLVKDTSGVTTAFTEKSRHCQIPKDQGPRFEYNEQLGRHISKGPACLEKAAADRQQANEILDAVFRGKRTFTYGELRAKIMSVKDIKVSGAEKVLRKFKANGHLKQTTAGDYIRA